MPDLRMLAHPKLIAGGLKVRAQRSGKTNEGRMWAVVIPYIDQSVVAGVLDRVVGPEGWSYESDRAEFTPNVGWRCKGRLEVYTLTPEGNGHAGVRTIVREAYGTNTSADGETGTKGADSDAFKRCAARLGIGRVLARIGEEFVGAEALEERRGKVYLKRDAEANLARQFAEQLRPIGERFEAQLAGAGQEGEAPVEAGDGGSEVHVDPETGEVIGGGQSPTPLPTSQDEVGPLLKAPFTDEGAGDARERLAAAADLLGTGIDGLATILGDAQVNAPEEVADGAVWQRVVRQLRIIEGKKALAAAEAAREAA